MATLKELAKSLNVSISTVSKALNDADDIGEETKKRVKELAATLDYKPNKFALGLKTKHSKSIGVILPDIQNPYFAEVLYGIEKAALDAGFDTLICVSNESYQQEVKSVRMLTENLVDGIIISIAKETLNLKDFQHLEKLKSKKIQLVQFDRVSPNLACDSVQIDDQESVKNATQQLIDTGKKHIALISGLGSLNVAKNRIQGYKSALRENGISKHIKILEVDHIEKTHVQFKNFIQQNTFDAVISIDNKSGIIFQNILQHQFPERFENVKIISFIHEKDALLTSPPLNYINQRGAEIGAISFNLLKERILLKEDETKNPVHEKVIASINFQ